MANADLHSIRVSKNEVRAALAHEHRRAVRRRLVAIDAILAGKSNKQAADAAKATRGSVERWIKLARQAGLQALRLERRRRYPKREMALPQMSEARRQIAIALAQQLKPQVRARLVAIDAVLSGQSVDEVAAAARVLPNAVKSWLRTVTYHGIAPTLTRWEGLGKPRLRKLDADPAALRDLAAKEKNARVRKRMLALACVAEGMSPHAAGLSAGLAHHAIRKWIERFLKEGIAGLRDRKIAGRPHKLSRAQLEEVTRAVLSRPELTCGELGDLIWARYRVRYSPDRLRRLLKAELGTEWKPARSHAGKRRTRAIAEDSVGHRAEGMHQEAGRGSQPAGTPGGNR